MLSSSPLCIRESKIINEWLTDTNTNLNKNHKVHLNHFGLYFNFNFNVEPFDTFKAFCRYMSDNCGIKNCDLRKISHIDDILSKVEFNETNLLPNWANKEILKKLHEIKVTKFYFAKSSKEIQKIKTGEIVLWLFAKDCSVIFFF